MGIQQDHPVNKPTEKDMACSTVKEEEGEKEKKEEEKKKKWRRRRNVNK